MEWTPERIIALTIVVGCLCLIGLGINSEVKSVFALSVGWIFRSLYMEDKKRNGGKRNVER